MAYKKAYKQFLCDEDNVLDDSFVSTAVVQKVDLRLANIYTAALNLYDGKRGEAVLAWQLDVTKGLTAASTALQALRRLEQVTRQLSQQITTLVTEYTSPPGTPEPEPDSEAYLEEIRREEQAEAVAAEIARAEASEDQQK